MGSRMYVRVGLGLIVVVFTVIFTPLVLGHDYLFEPGGEGVDPNNVPGVSGSYAVFDSNTPSRDERDVSAEDGDPVYLKNGEHYFFSRDLTIKGRTLDVVIERRFRSGSEYNSRFGYGWDMNYNMKVRRLEDPNIIILLDGKNSKKEYTVDCNDPNIYVRSTDPGSFFYYDVDDTFTLVKKHGTELHFDISGNLTTIADRHGNSITFEYDANGLLPIYGPSEFFVDPNVGGPSNGRGLVAMAYKLTTIIDDIGREINLSYNEDGLLETITDFADRTWVYDYNSTTNNLVSVTGPATDDYPDGLITIYAYEDANDIHNLTSVTDPNGQSWLENVYDGATDRVVSQIYGDGTFTLSYNPDSNEADVNDRRNFERKTVYNSAGNIVSRTIYTTDPDSDPNSYTTSYEYYTDQKIKKVTFPKGNSINYTYDDNGNVLSISGDPNNGEPNITTTYAYEDEFNFVKTITDPIGNATTCTYDYEDPNYGTEVGNLMKITYPEVNTPAVPNSPVVSFTYYNDVNEIDYGQVETVTAPDEIVTKYEYYADANDANNYGRLWKAIADYNETDGFNITIEFKYDILGNVIGVNDPNGNVTQFAYNELHQLTKITAPSPYNYVTNFQYDECKMLSQVEREKEGNNQIASFSYNILDKLKTVTDPLGYDTTNSYDASENLSDINDAEENNTHFDYDERDLLWKVTAADGNVTEYSYTPNGRLAEVNDPNGNITSYIYDGFDRLICITYPDDTNEVFGYDAASNITSWKNRKDETIYYEYDALNRVRVKNRPNEPNIIIRYDIAGRVFDVNDLRDVDDGGGLTEYYYDRIGRVTDVVNPDEKTVSYEYDERGLRTKLNHPGPGYTTYKYDALGRLTQVKHSNTNLGNNGVLAEYTYGELSRRTLLTLGNDANAIYEYDLANRLKKLTNNLDDTNSIVFDYSDYDKVGNRLSCKIDDANAHVYEYDNLYQLIVADYNDGNTTDYYYDCLGNRTSVDNGGTTGYALNDKGLNQYGSVGGVSYSYDNNGNLTDDGTYLYYYDCENRLTDVNNQSDEPVISYKYDFAGRRMRKIVHGSPDVITKYCYDGDQVIVEYNDSNVALRRFFYGPGIDEPVCMQGTAAGGGAGVFYYHYDGLGSVVAISDANGVIVEKYEYDVFGEPNTTSSIGNPYLFTGRRYDDEIGLYYYRARYYSPEIGRFLQTDPIYYLAGLNLYTYVRNNPVNFTDPLGLWKSRYHAELTRITMRRRGFSESQIDIAIRSNVRVDRLSNQLYDVFHFMPGTKEDTEFFIDVCLDTAVLMAATGQSEAAMSDLGEGLHILQDRYAHYQQNAGWLAHFPWIGSDPDNPYKHMEEYLDAYEATKDYIDEFLRRLEELKDLKAGKKKKVS